MQPRVISANLVIDINRINLGGLPEDINYYFNRQPWSYFLHSLYTPPVCLEGKGILVLTQYHSSLITVKQSFFFFSIRHTYLIVVAFGEEQGTKLAVQRRLVGLVAMFG